MRRRRLLALFAFLSLAGVGCHGSRLPGVDVIALDLPGQDPGDAFADVDGWAAPDPGGLDPSTDGIPDAAMPDPATGDPIVPDLGPHDPGPLDPGGDLGRDLAIFDPGPGDPGIFDPGIPDATPPDTPVFRASELAVVEPDFCLQTGGGGCAVDTAKVNAFLASAVGDPKDPLNLLLRFVPFEIGDPDVDLFVGGGPCQFVGATPIGCAFSATDEPAVFEGPLFLPDGCGPPGHPVPCFETPEEKVEMWFMGTFLAMHRARVSGWIETGPAGVRITHGVLRGHVPVTTTKTFQIALPGGLVVSLYDLVKHNPVVDLDGVKTFVFEFRFRADAVAYLD